MDHWPLVVSAELAQALQEAQVTGLELVPVGPDRPVQWYGMRVTHRLPPVAIPPTRLPRDQALTPQCARRSLVERIGQFPVGLPPPGAWPRPTSTTPTSTLAT